MRKYRLSVHTDDRSNAGTNSNVYIKMFGTKGSSGKRWLKKSRNNSNKFEQGKTWVQDKWSQMTGGLSTALTNAKNSLTTKLDGIVQTFRDLPGRITGALANIGSAITRPFSGVGSKITTSLGGLGDKIKAPINSGILWTRIFADRVNNVLENLGIGRPIPKIPYLKMGGELGGAGRLATDATLRRGARSPAGSDRHDPAWRRYLDLRRGTGRSRANHQTG